MESPHSQVYSALDDSKCEIRLLHLLPGPPDEPVQCTLQVVALDEAPKFSALSYVWGDVRITRDIMVDGHQFPVTTNLHSALEDFRAHGFPYQRFDMDHLYARLRRGDDISQIRSVFGAPGCSTYGRPGDRSLSPDEILWDGVSRVPVGHPQTTAIWVDAVCINQADATEKSFQVANMDRIYSTADTVFACLRGEYPEVTHLGIRTIRTIAPAARMSMSMAQAGNKDAKPDEPRLIEWISSPRPFLEYVSTPENPTTPISAHDMAALRSFGALPYFHRLWIFQELLLAKRVLFLSGPEHCRQSDLNSVSIWSDILAWNFQSTFLGPPLPNVSHDTWQELRGLADEQSLGQIERLRLMFHNSNRSTSVQQANVWNLIGSGSATDSRDYAYAVLSLPIFNRLRFRPLHVDYSKSKQEVYLEWAVYISGLRPLGYSNKLIPSFLRKADARRAISVLLYSGNGFSASDDGTTKDPAHPSWVPDLEMLQHRQIGHFNVIDHGRDKKVDFYTLVSWKLFEPWPCHFPVSSISRDSRVLTCYGAEFDYISACQLCRRPTATKPNITVGVQNVRRNPWAAVVRAAGPDAGILAAQGMLAFISDNISSFTDPDGYIGRTQLFDDLLLTVFPRWPPFGFDFWESMSQPGIISSEMIDHYISKFSEFDVTDDESLWRFYRRSVPAPGPWENSVLGRQAYSLEETLEERQILFRGQLEAFRGSLVLGSSDFCVGVAPPETRAGDRLFAVLHLPHLVVLREEKGHGAAQRWKYVGPCYMGSMMEDDLQERLAPLENKIRKLEIV